MDYSESHIDGRFADSRSNGDKDINPPDMTATPRHSTRKAPTSLFVQVKQEFELDTFWNSIRPPETALTSNGHNFCIRTPFEFHEYLMESLSRPLSNGSSLTSKFLLYVPKLSKEDVLSPV